MSITDDKMCIDDDNVSTHEPFTYLNSVTLNLKYYESDNYNKLRRCKLLLFTHCLGDNKDFDNVNKLHENDTKRLNRFTDILTSLNIDGDTIQLINKYMYERYPTKEYIAECLERGCLNRSIEKAKKYNIRGVWVNEKFINLYHSICYKVASNIDSTSSINSDFIRLKILNGEVELSNLANMTSKELCPKKYEQIDAKMHKRTTMERKIKYSGLHRCRKCKRNQCTTERRYNQSWDEGVNLTIHCTFCSHSWNA